MDKEKPINIYFSFAEKDRTFVTHLQSHLGPLKFNQPINEWDKSLIPAGGNQAKIIAAELGKAHLILQFISANYFFSYSEDKTTEDEFNLILRLHEEGIPLIPIIVRDCNWNEITILDGKQVLPKNELPISQWVDADQAYKEIVAEINQNIKSLKPKNQARQFKDIPDEELHQHLGKLLKNQFIIDKKPLGSGSSGIVYAATDIFLRRKVAIKTIKPRALSKQIVLLEDIKKEAFKVAGYTKHPNILTVHAARLDLNPPFIILEFVNGRNLKKLINDEGPQPLWEVTRILVRIVDALEYGHSKGLIHNNLSPSNILIDEEFNPLISPFEIIRSSYFTGQGVLNKNRLYWSPERLKAKISPEQRLKSDQFSLGVIAYEMVTGQLLYEGNDEYTQALNRNKLLKDDEALSKKVQSALEKNGCSQVLQQTILTMLQIDPEKRFASMGAAKQALKDARPNIDNDTKKVISSYLHCIRANSGFIADFYEAFKSQDELAKQLFTRLDMQEEWHIQYQKLHHALNSILKLSGNTNPHALKNTTISHQVREIKAPSYKNFKHALLSTIQKHDPDFENIKTAWEKIIDNGIALMTREIS